MTPGTLIPEFHSFQKFYYWSRFYWFFLFFVFLITGWRTSSGYSIFSYLSKVGWSQRIKALDFRFNRSDVRDVITEIDAQITHLQFKPSQNDDVQREHWIGRTQKYWQYGTMCSDSSITFFPPLGFFILKFSEHVVFVVRLLISLLFGCFQCFMNSVLQCLSNTRSVLEYVISNEYANHINTSTSSMNGALIKGIGFSLLRI